MKNATNHPRKRTQLICLLSCVVMLAAACTPTTGKTTNSPTTAATMQATNEAAATEKPSYFNATGYPICAEPITLTVAGDSTDTFGDWNDTVLVAEIEKRLGIHLDCTSYAAESWKTQLTLMLSTNTLPDLLLKSGLSAIEVSDYGNQGYFLAMNDLIGQYAPNLCSYMDKFKLLKTYMTSADGKIYMTVKVNDNLVSLTPRVWMNNVWLTNVGKKSPTTLDELYNVLLAFKEQDANGNGDAKDEIPMSNLDASMQQALLTSFGIYSTSTEYLLQADNSGKTYTADTTDNFKAYLKYLHRLYEEGLLDPEVFIQTGDELNAKIAENRVGYFGAAAPYVSASKDISYDANFIWSGAYTSELSNTAALVYAGKVSSLPVVIASAKTKYPEAIIRLVDYFYTDEGINASTFGYEAITFDWADIAIDGQTFVTDSMHCPEGYDSGENYRTTKAIINTGFYHVQMTVRYNPLYSMKYESLLSKDALNKWGWAALMTSYGIRNPAITAVDAFPTLIYTADESKTRLTLSTDIITYLKTAKAQFITGEVGIEEGWDSYLSTLSQMGIQDLLAIDQAAYSRLIASAK